jgi:hypothetical protein
MELKKLKRIAYTTYTLFLALAFILLFLAFIAWPKWIYTGVMYLGVGITQLNFSGTLFIRLRKKQMKEEIGTVVVQHSWWLLSIALASMMIFLAPFFKVFPVAIVYTAVSLAVIWFVLGSIDLYIFVKETGVPLAV